MATAVFIRFGPFAQRSSSRNTTVIPRRLVARFDSDVVPDEGAVHVVRWPEEAELFGALAETNEPVLAVVADGVQPPVTSECSQDWIRADAPDHELRARLRQVLLRSARHGTALPRLDEFGLVHFGLRSVALSRLEARICGLLIEQFGDVVARDDLLGAGWPGGVHHPNLLVLCVSRLRRRTREVGLEITAVPGHGYVMRVAKPSGADDVRRHAFDDELDRARMGVPSQPA